MATEEWLPKKCMLTTETCGFVTFVDINTHVLAELCMPNTENTCSLLEMRIARERSRARKSSAWGPAARSDASPRRHAPRAHCWRDGIPSGAWRIPQNRSQIAKSLCRNSSGFVICQITISGKTFPEHLTNSSIQIANDAGPRFLRSPHRRLALRAVAAR